MFKGKRHLIVSVGLTGILALGALGCTSTSTKTVTTTVTDEDGNETTTTKVVTTDESGTQTTTTTTSASEEAADGPVEYTNEPLGFHATLPDDFVEADGEEDLDNEETVLYAVNDEDEVVFIRYRDLSVEPTFEGPNPWADAYADAMSETLEEDGEESVSMTTTEGKFAGVPCTILECRSTTSAGEELYRDYFFIVAVTDDGLDGLYVGVMANSEQSLEEIENCFVSMG